MDKMDFMKRHHIFFLLFFPVISMAHIKPITTFSLGSDSVYFSQNNPSVNFGSGVSNAYIGTTSFDTQFLGGLFLGAEIPVRSSMLVQAGVSYYENAAFQARGDIYQYGSASLDNAFYTYDIESKRVLAESKVLWMAQDNVHPYVDIGLGAAFNSARHYTETPYPFSGGSAYAMSVPFANKTTDQFTYLVGLGLDVDLGKMMRWGVGYRYVDLGRTGLGKTSLQQDANTLNNDTLTSNEFLMQFTVIC
jgi:opacity protein-like surface antigen